MLTTEKQTWSRKLEKYFVYRHRKASNGEIFYVGKGTWRRVKSRHKRNVIWNNIVKKHGFTAEIISSHEKEAEAYVAEAKEIKSVGLENLCNFLPGGALGPGAKTGPENPMYGRTGHLHHRWGKKWSREERDKISEGRLMGKKNKLSESGRKNLIDALKRRKGIKTGPMPSDQKKKISLAMTGDKNPSYKDDVFTFTHVDGDVFAGTRYDFFKYSGASRGNISSIITGRLEQTKGWRVAK